MDDMALLREYASRDSEAAFEALVLRRVNFVYSAALRQVRDPHLAEEITQAVFIILAQKAGRISDQTNLTGWLFRTTRFASLAQTRADAKRRQREQEAHMESEIQSSAPDPLWEQMSPLLDEALAQLGEKDRQAVLLRFFENKSLAEVGTSLGGAENTAGKRISRALEKLRHFLLKRGVVSTAAAIGGAISANSVQAAPAALVTSISAVAAAKGAAVSGSTLALINGALKIMAWSKAKTAIVISVGVMLAAGTTTVVVKEVQEHRRYPWQVEGFSSSVLDAQPPQVRILPSTLRRGGAYGHSSGKLMGTGTPVQSMVVAAYGFFSNPTRVVTTTQLPPEKYDFIASLPKGNAEALQEELKKRFGLAARREVRISDVLSLKMAAQNASGLRTAGKYGSSSQSGPGEFTIRNMPMAQLASQFEFYFQIPVVDQTGLTGNFDIDLKWNDPDWQHHNFDGLKQALRNQLGLELVPSREPIEMLVVEKVK